MSLVSVRIFQVSVRMFQVSVRTFQVSVRMFQVSVKMFLQCGDVSGKYEDVSVSVSGFCKIVAGVVTAWACSSSAAV